MFMRKTMCTPIGIDEGTVSGRLNWRDIYEQSASFLVEVIEQCAPSLDLAGKVILDAGCWWGWIIRYARDKGALAYGFDYDRAKLNDGMEFIGHEGLCVGDAQSLPFKNRAFDVVFSFHVMEHLPAPDVMLRDMHRVLKGNGELILAVPNDFSFGVLPFRPLRYLLKSHELFLRRHHWYHRLKNLSYGDDSHVREYTMKQLCRDVSSNGFDILNASSYGFELPYPAKGRLSRRHLTYLNRVVGPFVPPWLRAAHIVHARKIQNGIQNGV
jgi:SAM-dependent methyltransferase